jgi:hypothetical protein
MNDNPHVPVNQNGPQEEDEYEVLPILSEQDEPLQGVDDKALPPPAAQEPPRRGATPAAYEPPRGAPTQAAQEPPRGAPTQAAYEPLRGAPTQEEYEPPPPPVRSRPPRPGRRNRGKRVLVGLAALVVIAVVYGMYNPSSWQGIINTGISGLHHQSTPTRSTPTPASTPLPTLTPTTSSSVPSGKELILLNPTMVRQGSSMGVTGTGFGARATVGVYFKQRQSDPGQLLNVVHADKSGTFYDNLTVPTSLASGTFFIEARERGSTKVALAAGVIAGSAPQLKLSGQVGKPGDLITASLHGFSPGEPIKVYWNTMSGQPVATLQADGGGSVGQAPVQVPFGAAGVNTFLFVGARSQSLVAATFYLLSLYPTVKLSSYALRADSQLNFSGVGFGPGERVLVYMNSDAGQPIAVIQTTQHGTFTNASGFVIPFSLKGRQTLIFLGEQSRATVSVRWTVQPYMPNAQASTYGGLPGTTISFYASGFARQEIVHVYVGGGLGGGGTLVSCFNTDGRGNAAAAGSYVIPGNAQGKVTFALIGSKSGGKASATLTVSAAPSPVQVPPQPPFTCPLDGATK